MPSITKVTVNVGPSSPNPDDLNSDNTRAINSIKIEFSAAVSDTNAIFPLTVNVPLGKKIKITSGTATLVSGTTSTYKIDYSGTTTEPGSLSIGPDGTDTVIAGSIATNDDTSIVIAD